MYKNVKSRIILISVIVGLLLIGSLGFLYLTSINKIQNILNEENNIQAIIQKTQNIYSNSEISIAIIISKNISLFYPRICFFQL